MSDEAEYERWLEARIAEEDASALEVAYQASLQQEEYETFEEYMEWLDSKISLACEENTTSSDEEDAIDLDLNKTAAQASVFKPLEEIQDMYGRWWPQLPVSHVHGRSYDHGRILRLHGPQGYERVRQKLWKGARTMRSRFKRSSPPKKTLASSTSVAYFTINTQA